MKKNVILIGKMLTRKKKTLSLAESCTGGYISHLITSVPGSSKHFKGGIVAYNNTVKQDLLGVKERTLKNFGAVSAECALEMARGVRKKLKSNYAIAVTGIAGPGGAVKGKPVGTVYIAFASEKEQLVERVQLKGSRDKVIHQTARKALQMLLNEL